MRTFDHPNTEGGFKCPICGNGQDKPIVLIPIEGTGEGLTYEADQIHLDCIELMLSRSAASSVACLIQCFEDKGAHS